MALALSAKQVSLNLNIDVSTVNRTVRAFEITGSYMKTSTQNLSIDYGRE